MTAPEGAGGLPGDRPPVVVVAAIARNGVIGCGPDIPWHVPADFAHFKRLTMGGTLIMGRVTYDSIGRPLPGRRTIVVTRNPDWAAPGAASDQVLVAGSVPAAVHLAHDAATIFLCGGGQIYRAGLECADELVLSRIPVSPVGDVFFPPVNPAHWVQYDHQRCVGFDVDRYVRRGSAAAKKLSATTR